MNAWPNDWHYLYLVEALAAGLLRRPLNGAKSKLPKHIRPLLRGQAPSFTAKSRIVFK